MDNQNQDSATNHISNNVSPYKELANNSLAINKDSTNKILNHMKGSGDHAHKHKESSKHKENSSSTPKDLNGKSKDQNSLKIKENNKLKDGSLLNNIKSESHHNSISSKHSSSSFKDHKDPKLQTTKHNEHKSKEHKDKKSKEHKEHKEHKVHKDHKEHKSHKDKEHTEHKEHREHKDHKEHKDSKEKKHKDKQSEIKKESISPVKIKQEPSSPKSSPVKRVIDEGSDDDTPLLARKEKFKEIKTEIKKEIKIEKRPHDDSDDEPLSSRAEKVKKVKTEEKNNKRKKYDDEEDYKQIKKVKKEKEKKDMKKDEKKKKINEVEDAKPRKKKKEEVSAPVWKWWEEEKSDDGRKWVTLEHKGPVFAPSYEPLPSNIKFYYDGKAMVLTPNAEEVAGFYAKMLEHDYTKKDSFNNNFFKDWRKVMSPEEKEKITDLKKCNFTYMLEFFKVKSEERKSLSKEAKQKIKAENEAIIQEYGFCVIDGHKEKIGNFKIEPPGLFRGRGEHPKMGRLKKRIMPEDIIINCGKDSPIPKPPEGHKWKEVRHDNTVTWLVCWTENIQGQTKYIMLNPSSKLKGEKDWQKYETARKLKTCVDKIRANYREDWKSKEMRVRQRAVALYFIDKLALRAGNEKEEGETADTVGCCSLRVEHIALHDECDGKENVVEFDFLGKDSIRYQNVVAVEKRVFKNLKLFQENKQKGDDLFDRLNTNILNKHLQDLMDGLTAKVFRTYNASKTLQDQLNLLTKPEDSIAAKILSYNRANRAVAILCNHQRAKPKAFEKQMENLQTKIDEKKKLLKEAKRDAKTAKNNYKSSNHEKDKSIYDRKKKLVEKLQDQLTKLEVQATDKEENKEIALGTSKLNYLDPRISVAWCKKYDVPIEKIYNRTQRDKFRWAIDMAGPDYVF